MSRETDQFAINASDSSRCDRILKGQGTDEAGRCRSVHRQHIAVGLLVAGEHEVLALDFVFEARCEHGSDRTVDQTCRQCFFGCRTTFAFNEATGELARSTGSLAVVTHQWEEVQTRTGIAGRGGTKDHGVVVLNDHGGSGLFGQFTCFKRKRSIANFLFYSYFHNSILQKFFKTYFKTTSLFPTLDRLPNLLDRQNLLILSQRVRRFLRACRIQLNVLID